jgi:hypothetical protein
MFFAKCAEREYESAASLASEMTGLIQNRRYRVRCFFVGFKRFTSPEQEWFYFSASNNAGKGGIVPPHT